MAAFLDEAQMAEPIPDSLVPADDEHTGARLRDLRTSPRATWIAEGVPEFSASTQGASESHPSPSLTP